MEELTGAVQIIRESFLADKELYNALVSSIESAIKECGKKHTTSSMSHKIADRILGIEFDE